MKCFVKGIRSHQSFDGGHEKDFERIGTWEVSVVSAVLVGAEAGVYWLELAYLLRLVQV